MKNKFFKIFFPLVIILFLYSCDTDLDLVNPNSVTVESFFQNEADLTRAVNATYATLQDLQLISREWFFMHDLRSDDVATGGGQLETARYQILIGTNDPSNGGAVTYWYGLYRLIHRANVVIEKAPDIEEIEEPMRERLVGEAKFLRAWAYFELVTIWGGVPLYSEYVKGLSGSLPRATTDEVYTSIIANLQGAISSLPLSYSDSDIGRATQGAARFLLAKVYMQVGDYENAKVQAKAIIDSNQYQLVDNYNDNFLEETEYNAESVFEVGFMDFNGAYAWGNDGLGAETTIHNQEISPISWGNLIPSKSLVEEFESTEVEGNTKTDPRYKDCFYEVGDVIETGPLTESSFNIASTVVRGGEPKKVGWRKHTVIYKNASGYYPCGINERLMRYGELLLIMAECQNETDESEANVLATLNQLRDRVSVNMPHYPTANYPTATKDDRFRAIVHEKRVELAGEQIRNRDILRWRQQGKLTLLGGDPISYFSPNKYELMPIPQQEIDNNPNVGLEDQNPGY